MPSSQVSDSAHRRALHRRGNLVLDPRLTILQRRASVQLGWDPESALLLTPPDGVTPATLATLLRALDGTVTRPQFMWRACENGIAPADMSAILAELDDVGLLDETETAAPPVRAIRIHGRGPLSDALYDSLTGNAVRVSRSGNTVSYDVAKWRVDFVVLADDLVADPQLVSTLVDNRIPHLQVRIRDGKGIVGPLVVPGQTSCLRCADLIRCARDNEWPHLSAQMLGRVGRASTAAVLATAAIALGQLEAILTNHPRELPASIDATLELDLATHQANIRRWPRHNLCECWQTAHPVAERALGQP
ncbi:hypothetical protein [Antrihabitans spumae]|uniref:Bacteriocin biosynthesis cyclodehydratase domain-containing protein n=1 Tax=Antrihabitans spumae TaxID=3373370 RepID=A0ABW7JSM1_9NOCA